MLSAKDLSPEIVLRIWYRPFFPIVVSLILSISILPKIPTDNRLLAICLFLSIWLIPWVIHYIYTKPPKTKPGYIGILIGIESNSSKTKKDLERQLEIEINELSASINQHINFQCLFLQHWHVKQISESNSLKKYITKCEACLLIIGIVSEGRINSKEYTRLKIKTFAYHKPIPHGTSQVLSAEMSQILPNNFDIPKENDLQGLEISSEWISEGAKYIIALSALISDFPEVSVQILEQLKSSNKLSKLKAIPNISNFRKLIDKRLDGSYLMLSNKAYDDWRKNHNPQDMSTFNNYVEKFKASPDRKYDYYNRKAIYVFVIHRNVKEALRLIKECKTVGYPSWRYSKAFLEAYSEDLSSAEKTYKEAFKKDTTNSLSVEVEDFILWVIDEEPDKFQLHYCLGLINFHKKSDFISAKREFNLFLDKDDLTKKFEKERAKAKEKTHHETASGWQTSSLMG